MYTYQDLTNVGDNTEKRMNFVLEIIHSHKGTKLYGTAKIAEEYARAQNRTIMQYQKLLYTLSGRAVPDNYSANYKIPSNFFHRFITQQNQFLLGNGVSWEDEQTPGLLGDDFDIRLQEAGKNALICGVSFGFFNLDHLEVFSLLEFAPLYDEENGALAAGVRFWQVDSDKPLRATLYEMDGYTDYIWVEGKGEVLHDKRAYKILAQYTEADDTIIYNGENYPSFPIVPLWANPYRQSEIVGLREQIDAYDLIKSGFANDLDDVSQIYWTVSNAGGMDDIDLAQFLERMKTVKAASVSDGEQVQAHTIDVPFNAREAILDRLRRDMYRDYMALDTEEIANGAVTATQIRAAYEPMNAKADAYEYCVIDFIQGILTVAGIEDSPTFTRSMMVNTSEEISNVIQAAEFLSSDYVTRKILTLFGDGDKADEIIAQMAADELNTGFLNEEEPTEEEPEEVTNGEEEAE